MAPKTKIIGKSGSVNSYRLCQLNPIRGNQLTKPSKYCPNHTDGLETSPIVSMDLRPRTRAFIKLIPNTITSGEGCKRDDAVERYYDRTAGMFYMFRPCGIRLSHWEMLTAESLSSVFTWLIDLFGENPSDKELKGIVYDRSCDLHPFIERLARENNQIAESYSKLQFIVDIFHCEKHTQPKI